ncbi:hypothetical protein NL676_035360 [Syzygium grande]|nr:hypothetical protein NL676_035360 [Syzygium grande]
MHPGPRERPRSVLERTAATRRRGSFDVTSGRPESRPCRGLRGSESGPASFTQAHPRRERDRWAEPNRQALEIPIGPLAREWARGSSKSSKRCGGPRVGPYLGGHVALDHLLLY